MDILITQKIIRIPEKEDVDALERPYLEYLSQCALFKGARFHIVPNQLSLAQQMLDINPALIIITGGNNVAAKDFGDSTELDDCEPARDKVENRLIEHALAHKIPLLGICRGAHMINVYLGGKLTLFLQNHKPRVIHDCLYQGKTYQVNSYHQHGIMDDDLASDLIPIAYAPDSVIEAFIGNDKPILGVQWHPERGGTDKTIFEIMVKTHLREVS